MTVSILVSRLRRAYWPRWCRLIRLDAVRRSAPIAQYVDEHDPRRRNRFGSDGRICSVNRHDHGRIRYFMDEIEAGREIEPIHVDVEWDPGWTRPLGPCIDDGHHRYMAAVLLRRRRVPATFTGPDELRGWLVGERRRRPL